MDLEYQILFLVLSGIGGWFLKSNVKIKSSCFKCFTFEIESKIDETTDKKLRSVVITQPTFSLKKTKSRTKVPKDLSSSSESNTSDIGNL
tara:strand:+ start:273 stop:542 length:270 start_codon:yes stop_codon:yes gene_type:complete